jgi:hypothetical protein
MTYNSEACKGVGHRRYRSIEETALLSEIARLTPRPLSLQQEMHLTRVMSSDGAFLHILP